MFNLSVLTLRHNLKVKKTKQTKKPPQQKTTNWLAVLQQFIGGGGEGTNPNRGLQQN